MVKTAKMIERHLEGVMAHWLRRTSNAFLEGFDCVFSAVKRGVRGFPSTGKPQHHALLHRRAPRIALYPLKTARNRKRFYEICA
ncbi:MAG: transposase [Undibacterium sp.]|nr:transposase [Opitutaceae bacterium]